MDCANCGSDPREVTTGVLINRHAHLGSRIVTLSELIPKLEKDAGKSEKVRHHLELVKEELDKLCRLKQETFELLRKKLCPGASP